jgi:type IV pilus assembly protein PilX
MELTMTHAFTLRSQRFAPRTQRGVTLIVVLLILVVVMVLGIGAAQIGLLGERTTRFDRDYLIASQAAEAALMDAEFDIRGPGGTRSTNFEAGKDGLFIENCGNSGTSRGLCLPKSDQVKPVWAQVDFTDQSNTARTVAFGEFTGRAATFSTGSGIRPVRPPRYIIEIIDDQAQGNNAASTQTPKMYRVTAMGFGPRLDTQVVMQMVFRKEKG